VYAGLAMKNGRGGYVTMYWIKSSASALHTAHSGIYNKHGGIVYYRRDMHSGRSLYL
jgi:hypothetical protein